MTWRFLMRIASSSLWTYGMRVRLLRWLGVSIPWSATMAGGVFIGSTKVRFGENSGCNVGCFLDGSAPLVLEDKVRLGPNVQIITATHEVGDSERRCSEGLVLRPVTIGRGSWICAGAIVSGVDIAPGCVIAPGAIVTKPTEPNGLYAGAPAVRKRDLP